MMPSGARSLNYADLTMTELSQLEAPMCVLFMAVSPLEAHGPHLPVGSDLMISEALCDRYITAFSEAFPDYQPVRLPSLVLGADVLPRLGSIGVPARLLEQTLVHCAKMLSQQGFRYLVIADNHGGPRHLLGMEAAARRAFRKYNFYLINPFVDEFAQMLSSSEDLMRVTGLKNDRMGALNDLHAGTNETSLLRATHPEGVRDVVRQLSPEAPPSPGWILTTLERFLCRLGFWQLATDLAALGSIARWSRTTKSAYIGAPRESSVEAGEAMLSWRVNNMITIFQRVSKGESIRFRPPLWAVRFLRYLP